MAQYTYNPTFSEISLESFLSPINAIKELFDARRKEYNELNEVYSKLIAAGDLDIRDYLAPFEESRSNMANYIAGNRFNQSDMLSLAENMRLLWLDKGLKSEAAMTAYYKMKDALAKDPSNIHKSFSMKNFLDNIDFDPSNVSGDRLKALSKEAMESILKSLLKKINIRHHNSDYDIAHLYLGLEYGRKMDLIDKVFSDLLSGDDNDNSSKIKDAEERSYYDYVKKSMKDIISSEVKEDIMSDEELRNKVFTSLKGGATSLLRQDEYLVLHRPKDTSSSSSSSNNGGNKDDSNVSDLILKYYVKNNKINTKFVIEQQGKTNNFNWTKIAQNYGIKPEKLRYIFNVTQQDNKYIVITLQDWHNPEFLSAHYFKNEKEYKEFLNDFKLYCTDTTKTGFPAVVIRDKDLVASFDGKNIKLLPLEIMSAELEKNGQQNLFKVSRDNGEEYLPYKILPSINTDMDSKLSEQICNKGANETFFVDGEGMDYTTFKEKYIDDKKSFPLLTSIFIQNDNNKYFTVYSFTGKDDQRHQLTIGNPTEISGEVALEQIDKIEIPYEVDGEKVKITIKELREFAEKGDTLAQLKLQQILLDFLLAENTTQNNITLRASETLSLKDRTIQ